MARPFVPLVAVLAFLVAPSAPAAEPEWLVTAECQMVTLPTKAALASVPDLLDQEQFAKGWAGIDALLQKGDAKMAADLIAIGISGKLMHVAGVEELRYPVEFEPPQLPQEMPKENIAEALKSWPLVGSTPTAFETRNVGCTLETTPTPAADGKWVTAELSVEHVRLLRFDKFDAGVLPNGNHLSVEQPQFHSLKSNMSLRLFAGRKTLVGIHMLPGDQGTELFFIQFTVKPLEPIK